MKNIEEKLNILRKLYQSDLLYPFPYNDCAKISAKDDDDLIPSLDLYFSDIAGFCSWGKRILLWSNEQSGIAEDTLRKSFSQRFPAFTEVFKLINDKETPQLYNQILVYDLMRLTLIDILSEIENEKINRSIFLSELSPVN